MSKGYSKGMAPNKAFERLESHQAAVDEDFDRDLYDALSLAMVLLRKAARDQAGEEREGIELEADGRRDAHAALDRWLDECERYGPMRFNSGCSGYIGRIKLCAFVADSGITLSIERSIQEDL